MLLFFSKSCLLQDIYIQKTKKINLLIGTLRHLGTVIVTESVEDVNDLEFKDSDSFGKGRLLTNVVIDKDVLLKIIKESSSNREAYSKILMVINNK